MFVLDTNVISETFKPVPDAGVAAWTDAVPPLQAHITAPGKAELLSGLAIMPHGRRKAALGAVIEAFFTRWLKTEVLPFGSREAEAYAEIMAQRRRAGRPVKEFDAQIAAIARVRGFAVVTRNVRDFEHCGVEIINPWNP
jgi:predicted nucleic acid-binding protein